MNDRTDTPTGHARIDEFKREVEELKLKTAGGGREEALRRGGAVLMVIGIVMGVACYFGSTNQSDARDQNELIILALTGVAVSVSGAVLFLRYSMARFLRFWLLRQLYESQAQTEQLVRELKD